MVAVFFKSVKDIFVRGLGESTLDSRNLVVISVTQPLRAVVEGITEWLVCTFEDISASHEDLGIVSVSLASYRTSWRASAAYPLKSCRTCPRMRREKDWF